MSGEISKATVTFSQTVQPFEFQPANASVVFELTGLEGLSDEEAANRLNEAFIQAKATVYSQLRIPYVFNEETAQVEAVVEQWPETVLRSKPAAGGGGFGAKKPAAGGFGGGAAKKPGGFGNRAAASGGGNAERDQLWARVKELVEAGDTDTFDAEFYNNTDGQWGPNLKHKATGTTMAGKYAPAWAAEALGWA